MSPPSSLAQFATRAGSDFEAYPGGGDGVRRALGTVGTTSPLYQIEKAVRKLLPDAEDPAEASEALEDLMLCLQRADSMAYSSNFAGGSGNPAENSPKALMKKAKKEVVALQKQAKRLDEAL